VFRYLLSLILLAVTTLCAAQNLEERDYIGGWHSRLGILYYGCRSEELPSAALFALGAFHKPLSTKKFVKIDQEREIDPRRPACWEFEPRLFIENIRVRR